MKIANSIDFHGFSKELHNIRKCKLESWSLQYGLQFSICHQCKSSFFSVFDKSDVCVAKYASSWHWPNMTKFYHFSRHNIFSCDFCSANIWTHWSSGVLKSINIIKTTKNLYHLPISKGPYIFGHVFFHGFPPDPFNFILFYFTI